MGNRSEGPQALKLLGDSSPKTVKATVTNNGSQAVKCEGKTMPKGRQSKIGVDGPLEENKQRVQAIADEAVKALGLEDVKSSREAQLEKVQAEQQQSESSEASEETSEETSQEETEPTEAADAEVGEDSEASVESSEAADSTQEEEDLIPKSKVEDRFAEMTREIKGLREQLSRKEERRSETDSQQEKLEKLSQGELKTLRKQIRREMRNENDDTRYDQLLELEDKVLDMERNAPARFQQRQLQNLNEILPEASKLDPRVAKQEGELWEAAKTIYAESPVLQNAEKGQAEALRLAMKHYSTLKSNSSKAESVTSLKQKVNTLKKKTSLDGKSLKGNQKAVADKKLREAAVKGGDLEKTRFVRDVLIPEDYFE